MATKTIKLPVTVGIVDKANSVTEDGKDGKNGSPLVYKHVHVKHIEAGQPVTLDEDEANRLLAQYGSYDEAAAAAKAKGVTVTTARQ